MSKITELRDLSSSSLYIDYTSVMLFLKNSGVAQLGLEPTYASDVKPLSSWWVIKRPPFLAEDRKSVYTAPPPGSFPVLLHCGIATTRPPPHPPLAYFPDLSVSTWGPSLVPSSTRSFESAARVWNPPTHQLSDLEWSCCLFELQIPHLNNNGSYLRLP